MDVYTALYTSTALSVYTSLFVYTVDYNTHITYKSFLILAARSVARPAPCPPVYGTLQSRCHPHFLYISESIALHHSHPLIIDVSIHLH